MKSRCERLRGILGERWERRAALDSDPEGAVIGVGTIGGTNQDRLIPDLGEGAAQLSDG